MTQAPTLDASFELSFSCKSKLAMLAKRVLYIIIQSVVSSAQSSAVAVVAGVAGVAVSSSSSNPTFPMGHL